MSILYGNIGYEMTKRIALCLAIVLMMGMTLQVGATNSGILSDCTLSISCAEDGVRVSFSEKATTSADEIGCRDILLEEKTGLFSWKEISVESGYEKNSLTYSGSATYKNAVKGRTYRASCTHYAKFGDDESTLESSTAEMVYN